MEVACSLEDMARVLADSGYNFNDDSCFANAADLPSVLNVLDSPDSFPESPCSDEDIARVLEIARMPSPSLLDSCTSCAPSFPHHHHHYHHHHHHHLPSPTEGPHHPYGSTIHKTRDPCIADAVLQTSLLPSFHPDRGSTSLDLFSIALNCSMTDDNTPNFNTISSTKETDTFNNYFNSSSALSPVSETDTILSGSSESLINTKQPNHIPNDPLNPLIQNSTQTQVSNSLPSPQNPVLNENVSIPKPSETVTTKTKRKRRKKSSHVTSRPKRRKQQEKSDAAPKPKATPKPKSSKNKKDAASNLAEISPASCDSERSNVEVVPKRKCANSNTGERRAKKSKNSLATLETINEQENESGISQNVESDKKPHVNLGPTSSEIGSTNGVIENIKGPRRSSRATKNPENYNFRLSSIVKRVETERKQQEPKQPKDKVKPPPLSKYRRRTANARERDRMKEINEAFEVLKGALPDMEPEEGKTKITKFTILKLALNYISSLQDILELDPEKPNPPKDGNSSTTGSYSGGSGRSTTVDSPCSTSGKSSQNQALVGENHPPTHENDYSVFNLPIINKRQQELVSQQNVTE